MANVELRVFDEQLLPIVQRWFEDPQTQKWVGGPDWPAAQLRLGANPPTRTRGGRIINSKTLLAFDGSRPVGLLNFWTYEDRSTGVALVVDPARRGRGYGKGILAAFLRSKEAVDSTRVFSGVDPSNTPSVRMLEAAGLSRESESPDELGEIYYSVSPWSNLHVPARPQSWSTVDDDIRAWVDGVIEGAKSVLHDEIVGVYLHGSLAMGSYYRPKSDVDLLVVVRGDLASDVRERLAQAFLRSYDARPTTGGLEISVLTEAAAKRFTHPMAFEVHFSSSWADWVRAGKVDYATARTDPDLAAHLTVTRERGIALLGPEPKRVFGEVPWRDYVTSIKGDFDWIVEDDNLFTTPFYGVLNACRFLMVVGSGPARVPSKDEAGEWALRTFPKSQQGVVRQALDCYRDGSKINEADRQRHGHDWDQKALRSFRDYVAQTLNEAGQVGAGLESQTS